MKAWGDLGLARGSWARLRRRLHESHTQSFHLLLLHGPLSLHLLWYGSFSPSQQAIITDFLSSFHHPPPSLHPPSIPLWWQTLSLYKGLSIAPSLVLGQQSSHPSLTTNAHSLNKTSIAHLLQQALHAGALPTSPNSIYIVLTSQEVMVEDFCMSSCGYHASMAMEGHRHRRQHHHHHQVPFIWAGNAALQCPGQCAWPFALPVFGPQEPPLVAPNLDVGMDGMVINIATLLAGTVTNPFNTGYYQGDGRVPMEAASACTGLFGKGSYPGFPGQLLVNHSSGASYNAHGIKNRTFLLPALWNPTTSKCITLP